MGGVFPGATSLADFWKVVEQGRDTCKSVPRGRWPLDPTLIRSAISGAPDSVLTDRGCFVEGFTPDFSTSGLSRSNAESLDPAFHFLVSAGQSAFAQARTQSLDRSRVGVIVGSIALPTAGSSALCDEALLPLFEHKLFGAGEVRRNIESNPLNRYVAGLPAAVLAGSLGLQGGCYGLDAACASSLYAIKLACDELREHRASAMLAGGLSRPDSLYTQMGFSQLRALSPTGRCSPFDRKGDGLIVGEGAGIVVLKRLDDALRDGDHILALIRGAGLSNDIEGNLLSPSSEGQLRALHQAYAQAGWSPDMVDLIECHATGTPVGDAVEFETLARLWQETKWRDGQCVLSAVKSNIGHLLTAAGSAGLIKTLLAMEHGTLPPVANFDAPSDKVGLAGSPFSILKQSRPWERRSAGVPRRAAINGFGFGGINAHLLIEEWLGESVPSAGRTKSLGVSPVSSSATPEPMAIVGMAVRVGHWADLQAFWQHVSDDSATDNPAPRKQWRGLRADELSAIWGEGRQEAASLFPGYYLDDLSVPINRFHIPPRELAQMLPQQLLMLDVAKSALQDARDPALASSRTGVFIGLGLDLRTTDFHFRWTARQRADEWARRAGVAGSTSARQWVEQLCDGAGPPLSADRTLGALGGIVASRVARELHIGGPSHAICSEDTSGLRALDVAVRALRRGELDLALVGAVDLTGDLRTLLATDAVRPYSRAGRPRPFDVDADGAVPGEGAVCLVVKRLADAQRDGDRVYALIRGVGTAQGNALGTRNDTTAYGQALAQAYAEADVAPASVQLVEAHGSGSPAEDAAEAHALVEFFGTDARNLACNISSAKADVGHTGAASGLVSLVKASLCVYHEVIPGLRHHRQSRAELAARPGMYLPHGARQWLRDRVDGPRRAGVSAMGVEGGCIHVVLEGVEARAATPPMPAAWHSHPPGADALFTVSGPSPVALSNALAELGRLARSATATSIEQVARHWWKGRGAESLGPHRCALLARSVPQLQRLIALAATGADDALRGSEDYERIFLCNPAASGHPGRIAFVFPGSGNQFDGMGSALALRWPEVLRAQDVENERLASQFGVDQFWNGSLSKALLTDHRALIRGQVTFGTMVADLAARFGIKPTAAIGYSLGESTALFALRAWRQRDAMLERLNRSSLFAHDLTGDVDVLRRSWRVSDNQQVEWITGMVDRSVELVRAAIGGRKRVYVLIINTADECVIGGDRAEVEDVVAGMGCLWFPLQGVGTVHCELVGPVRKAYRELHQFETMPPPDVEFYSCAWGRAYTPDRETAADAIEAQALDTIDFPRVIRAAYAAGVHTFVEIGPGNSCSRMIGKILEDRPHFAKSLSIAGPAPVTHFLRTVGQLYAEGVPVSLDMLYGEEGTGAVVAGDDVSPVVRAGAGRNITVSISGAPLSVPVSAGPDAGEHGVAGPAQAAVPEQTIPDEADPSYQVKRALEPAAQPDFDDLVVSASTRAEQATVDAHQAYLRFSEGLATSLAQAVAMQVSLLNAGAGTATLSSGRDALVAQRPRVLADSLAVGPSSVGLSSAHSLAATSAAFSNGVPRMLDRAACLEFGRGLVGRVLGPRFAAADAFPTRVRLPDEPLMLVDRIVEIDAEPLSMTHGRVVTEHDIHPGAWYLDGGRIPTCIAVEAGQADLFLSGYLGIDFETHGHSVYRLLDAKVCFHRGLPGPGEVIHYDIRIERFFRQSDTWLFKFNFEATVNGEPLLSMTDGCAGFFSRAELAAGKGVVRTALDLKPIPGKRTAGWEALAKAGVESYSAQQLDALREGDLATCLGSEFIGLPVRQPVTLPGGRMKLVHRIAHLDPAGGRFGLGLVRGEADIRPDDWFLKCHFVDDQVMPGTLMFECCLHTLRVFLLRLGWIAEAGQVVLEPVPGVASQLKCRGQVLSTTRVVTYEVSVKEIGYRPEPYAIADALMYADGKPIVEITNMSVRYAGTTREAIESIWAGARVAAPVPSRKPPIFTYEDILAFAVGKPSDAFGEPYRVFDAERVIARLPGPPFQFMDRVTEIRAEPWKIVAGGEVESQYDVPPDAWYFSDNRQGDMPFAVLLEIALQPCGWLAAYMGSALTSDVDVSFRNLGGTATQFVPVRPDTGTLSVRVKLTRASSSAGMIIQFFDYEVRVGRTLVYKGDTYFGFFPKIALQKQEGLKDAKRYQPSQAELSGSRNLPFPEAAPFPGGRLRMLDRIECWAATGGPKGLGFIRATRRVRPDEWFFKAHFYQDPVVPGSLGLESFLQLLKFIAVERWGHKEAGRLETVAMDQPHQWTYRGQVIPADAEVTVEATVTAVDDADHLLRADGYLCVDGRVIYAMQDFTVRQRSA